MDELKQIEVILTDAIKSSGIYGLISVAAIFVFKTISVDYIKGLIYNLIENISLKTNKGHTNIKESKQDLLNKINIFKSVTIPSTNIKDLAVKMIYVDLMTLKLSKIEEMIEQLYKSSKSTENINVEFLNQMNGIAYSHTHECIDNGIPKVIVRSFKNSHQKLVKYVIYFSNSICKDKNYQNIRKLELLFLLMDAFVDLLLEDSEASITSTAISIKGIEYKGFVIGDSSHGD